MPSPVSRLFARTVGLGAAVIAVVAVLLFAVLTGPGEIAGTARPVAAADLAETALAQLGAIEDLRLSGTIESDTGVALTVDVVALAGGETTAAVADGTGGVAEFVAVDDRVVVNANREWWLNTVPVHAEPVAGKWVRATADMGFPIGMLDGLSGAALKGAIEEAAGSGRWSSEVVERPDGQLAFALTAADSPWAVHLAARGEPRLLGVDGPLAEVGDRLLGSARGGSFPNATVSTTAADDPCRKRADSKVADARKQVASAPQAPAVPTPSSGPSVRVSVTPTALCTSPVCPAPVVVANSGDQPAVGVVSLTSSSGGGGTQPFSAPPGGQDQKVFQITNPATGCRQTCTRTASVTAFAQITSIAGPDIDLGQRLTGKGVDPNRPVPGNPAVAGPDVNRIIDGLTGAPGVPGFSGRGAQSSGVDQVLDLMERATDNRVTGVLLWLVGDIAKVRAPGGPVHPVVDLAEKALSGTPDGKLAAVSALQLLADLAAQDGRPDGSLVIGEGLITDTHTGRVHSIGALAAADNATVNEKVYELVEKSLARFDGPGVTAGFERVLVLEFAQPVPKFGAGSRVNVGKKLNVEVDGKPLRALFLDGSGKPKITRLMVGNHPTRERVDGRHYSYDAEDLAALTHQRDQQPPTSKPTPGDLVHTPGGERHILQGDPDDPAATRHGKAGGHQSGAGGPSRTEFPPSWTPEDIKAVVARVVDQGRTVDTSGAPANGPNSSFTSYGTPIRSWRYLDTVTHKGVTIEVDVIVFADGSVRTAYPTAGGASPNRVVTREDVHVHKTATIGPNTIFKNPAAAPASPQLNSARTGSPRYDQKTDTWRYPALDARGRPVRDPSGKPVEYRTDDTGKLAPGSPVPPPTGNC
ncbi:hypothetical protein UO65_4273 [Actinokineospora spheciospongiae]|uniref:Uncharacterized protein n=1 Tax=Actinokineospora spheciospongiae TaxID=909613 RepID=W7IHS9_9PSEU|nr:EndoU domain-containing protein [Actinokineospora spheciospongiae]EWC60460.1 hypothetical protein UO65_4273 [Actinokineospora spheciospongiae]